MSNLSVSLNMASCPTSNFCLLWHWHIIFDTWVYHYEAMCCVLSCSEYDKRFLTLHCFLATTSLSFNILVVMHGTMCYINTWPLCDFDFKPHYQNHIFMINLCLSKSVFALNTGILNLAHWCTTMREHVLYIHDL